MNHDQTVRVCGVSREAAVGDRKRLALSSRPSPKFAGFVIALLALTGSVGGLAAASATRTPVTASALSSKAGKPDLSFCAGKQITFITGGAPGGTNYSLAAIIAPLMASYLHCSINVVDVPQGNTIPAQNDAAAAAPNGLTFGQLGPPVDIENDIKHVAGIDFSLQRVPLIGGIQSTDNLLVTSPKSGYRTMSSLMNSPATFNLLDETGGITDVEERVLVGAYNVRANIVTGYANAAAELAGFLRGDGSAVLTSVTSIEGAVQAGQAVVVAQTTPGQKGLAISGLLKKVPTLAEYFATHKPGTAAGRAAMAEMISIAAGTNQILFAPQGTPPAIVAALTAAFRSALAQKSAQASLIAAGLAVGYLSPAAGEAQIKSDVKHAQVLARYLDS